MTLKEQAEIMLNEIDQHPSSPVIVNHAERERWIKVLIAGLSKIEGEQCT